MAVAPAATPTVAARHVARVKASGAISRATSASIAPAANAKETGSNAATCCTSRNASTAPNGWGALVRTAAQNCGGAPEPTLLHRDGDRGALRHVLQRDGR